MLITYIIISDLQNLYIYIYPCINSFNLHGQTRPIIKTYLDHWISYFAGLILLSGAQYKDVCCRLDERGAVGETPLHVCLLNATSLHADLAKRLLRNYPKLLNDIYISDEYYGKFNLTSIIFLSTTMWLLSTHDNGWDIYRFSLTSVL